MCTKQLCCLLQNLHTRTFVKKREKNLCFYSHGTHQYKILVVLVFICFVVVPGKEIRIINILFGGGGGNFSCLEAPPRMLITLFLSLHSVEALNNDNKNISLHQKSSDCDFYCIWKNKNTLMYVKENI